jgi:hypothetical protein
MSAAHVAKEVGGVVLTILLFLGLFVGSAYLHLPSAIGKVALAEGISRAVSGAIRGRFVVEGVRSAWLPVVRVDTIRALDPEGGTVVELHDATVGIDLGRSLSQRGFYAYRASVHSGHVRVASASGGKLGIERAFDSPGPDAGSSRPAPERRVLDIQNISFRDIEVTLAAGTQPVRFDVTTGEGELWLRPRDEFQARFWGLSGDMRASNEVIPSATFTGTALTIDPHGSAVAHWAGRADLFGTQVTLAGHAPMRSGSGVRLCVWTEGVSLVTLGGFATELVDGFIPGLSFDLRPSEAPSDPRCEEGQAS